MTSFPVSRRYHYYYYRYYCPLRGSSGPALIRQSGCSSWTASDYSEFEGVAPSAPSADYGLSNVAGIGAGAAVGVAAGAGIFLNWGLHSLSFALRCLHWSISRPQRHRSHHHRASSSWGHGWTRRSYGSGSTGPGYEYKLPRSYWDRRRRRHLEGWQYRCFRMAKRVAG